MSQTNLFGETETSVLSMRLPRLPDWAKVGGNARFANMGHRISAYDKEKQAWAALIREAKAPSFDTPHITGPFKLRIVLHLPHARVFPDFDNAVSSLKILIDLLEPMRVSTRGNRGRTSGMLGWVSDDKNAVWPWELEKVHKSPYAPMIEVEVTPL